MLISILPKVTEPKWWLFRLETMCWPRRQLPIKLFLELAVADFRMHCIHHCHAFITLSELETNSAVTEPEQQ
jgi:hypothetical protein